MATTQSNNKQLQSLKRTTKREQQRARLYEDIMMTATEEKRNQIRLAVPQSEESATKPKTTMMIEKPRKYWAGSNFLQAVNVCDKFFNCAYVKFQLEQELMEERKPTASGNIERLWHRMDSGVEVEVYRQFLFEENGLEPFEDLSYHHDHRDGTVERPQDQEPRTPEQE